MATAAVLAQRTASSRSLSCGQCGDKSTTDKKLMYCSICHFQAYCNKECQKKHWPEHKKVCSVPKTSEHSSLTTSINQTSTYAANQSIIEPNRSTNNTLEINVGIIKALEHCKQAIANYARQGDDYGKLMARLIDTNSEQEAIQLINNLGRQRLDTLITDFIQISTRDGKNFMMFNVLRISALQRRFFLMQSIFEKIRTHKIKFDKNDKEDRFGWNIAHFVALHSTHGEFPATDIPEVNRLMDTKNKAGASPRDFALWLSRPNPPGAITVFGEEHPPLNPEQFKEQVGGNYWTRPFFTPGALLRTYFEVCEMDSPKYLTTLISCKINEFIEDAINGKNPNLKIQKMQEPPPMKNQWECLTSQDVDEGDILALYSGTVRHRKWDTPSQTRDKAHGLSNDFFIDAENGGSLSQFINHSFPNCACFPHLYKGLPMLAIVALQKLKSDTRLYLSYGGPQFFKERNITPISLNPNEIDQYLNAIRNRKTDLLLEISPDGLQYCYIEKGRILWKRLSEKATLSQTMNAYSNKNRLIYLVNHHLEEMKKNLDPKDFQLLLKEFKN